MKKAEHPNNKAQLPKHLQQLNLFAAGIDIGSKSHFVAVPEGTDEQPVREFQCFTADLHRLVDWLISPGHHGRHGINRSLLDSTVRDSGVPRP